MNSNNLTVIIKDTNNNLVKGAQVSLNPGNIHGKTDEKGQVNLTLPDQKKVIVTVKLNDITQEVPFYVTGEKTNRLEINLAYFQQIKTQETKSLLQNPSQSKINPWPIISIILIIVLISITVFYFKKINNRKIKFILETILTKFKKIIFQK